MSYDKKYDEGYQISKNDEEKVTKDIEVLELGNLVHRKKILT